MPTDQHQYRAFLLRLWKERIAGVESLRASLEDAQTHERRRFGDLENLFAFLRKLADRIEIPPQEEDKSDDSCG